MTYQSIILNTKSSFKNPEEILSLVKKTVDLDNDFDPHLNLLIEVEQGKSIGIEDIKKITNWSYLKSEKLKYAIIPDAHRMTIQAQNSLLKLFEETPQNTVITLITSNYRMLLDTILSRALIVNDNSEDKKSVEIVNLAKKYFQSNIIEKDDIVKELLNKQKNDIEVFLVYIFELAIQNRCSTKILSLIKDSIAGINSGTSPKLIFESLGINLTHSH